LTGHEPGGSARIDINLSVGLDDFGLPDDAGGIDIDFADDFVDGGTGRLAGDRFVKFVPILKIKLFGTEGESFFGLFFTNSFSGENLAGGGIHHANVDSHGGGGRFKAQTEPLLIQAAPHIIF